MAKEKPVKIIPGTGKHKTETRVFARNIHESYCVHKSCKFFGQPAQQGVCHTTTTFAGDDDWTYIEHAEKLGEIHLAHLRETRKKYGTQKYIRRLEGEMVCAWINTISSLDELIYLRREVALLRHRLGKHGKASR